MRIGILTHFHKSTNYGGVLQAYALCKYLNNRGHLACQILYTHKATKISTAAITPKELCTKVLSRFKKKIYKKQNQQIKKRMENLFFEFRDSVPHTNHEYSRANIRDVSNDFDVFITGSDQIWNPIWYDSTYMLDFLGDNTAKISYAASMGVSCLDEEQKKIFSRHLTNFKDISVREKTAVDMLLPIINKEVNVSVDPTLLLSVEEWDEVASKRKIEGNYVFLYLLGNDIKARKIAENFAKTKGLKLVMIPDLMGTYRKNDRKIHSEKIIDATPCDFISLIKYAECIFTDSFHACVFSLLYQKEFFAFKRVGSMEMGSRIQHLTELFECSERFCVNKNEMNLEHLLSLRTIDYSKKHDLFIKEKNESIDYLEANLC